MDQQTSPFEASREWLAKLPHYLHSASSANTATMTRWLIMFLSYVRENSAVVERLAADLEAAGVRVWLDRTRLVPGERWPQAIRKAIRNGRLFIACFSREFAIRERSHMSEELTLAIEELRRRPADRKWFIPVVIDDAEIPDRDIGATLRDLHCVNLATNWTKGVTSIAEMAFGDQSQTLGPSLTDVSVLVNDSYATGNMHRDLSNSFLYADRSEGQKSTLRASMANRRLRVGAGCAAMFAIIIAVTVMAIGIGTVVKIDPKYIWAAALILDGVIGAVAFLIFGYAATNTERTPDPRGQLLTRTNATFNRMNRGGAHGDMPSPQAKLRNHQTYAGCVAMPVVMFAITVVAVGIGQLPNVDLQRFYGLALAVSGLAGLFAFVFFGYSVTDTDSTRGAPSEEWSGRNRK